MAEGRGDGGWRARLSRWLGMQLSGGGHSYRKLAIAHAASAAGDTVVAVALAGTLFFSVPAAEARANVAMYLGLTLAPFAVLGPILGAFLVRSPTAYRHGMVWSAALRVLAALVLTTLVDSAWLFPLALALLVFSRLHGISRNSVLPITLHTPQRLVSANAALAKLGLFASAAVLPFAGAAAFLGGPPLVLVVAAATFAAATAGAVGLPDPPLPRHRKRRFRELVRVHQLPASARLAQFATALVRLLNGFLLLLLLFALRSVGGSALSFGALLAAGGFGYFLASVISPWLEQRMREEPMVVAALALEAGAAFVASQWFGLPAASVLAAAAGLAWGTAKFAFDGLLQTYVHPDDRGVAFTRSETFFQLTWVVGALIPVGLHIPVDIGLVGAGITALTAQVAYAAELLMRQMGSPPPQPPETSSNGDTATVGAPGAQRGRRSSR